MKLCVGYSIYFLFPRLEIERKITTVQKQRKIFLKQRSKINFQSKLSNEILKSQITISNENFFSEKLRVAEIKRSLH